MLRGVRRSLVLGLGKLRSKIVVWWLEDGEIYWVGEGGRRRGGEGGDEVEVGCGAFWEFLDFRGAAVLAFVPL